MQLSEITQQRLIMALAMAHGEIHNPGVWRDKNCDIDRLIEAVLKEADRDSLALKVVREQLTREYSFTQSSCRESRANG